MSQTIPGHIRLYHWRANSGAEVNLIIEHERTFYPIAIKCKTLITKRDVSGIKAFITAYPHLKIGTAIVLYAGDTCYAIEPTIFAVPWDGISSS